MGAFLAFFRTACVVADDNMQALMRSTLKGYAPDDVAADW